MINLKSIDLIAVDGSLSLDRLKLLINIARHCESLCQFNSVKILSGYPPSLLSRTRLNTDNIQVIPVILPSLSAYSDFVLSQLYKYVDAKHCLLYQHDGFILNPDRWTQKFLEYDYIGAPWKKDAWFLQPGAQNKKRNRVGNGGFSLRSKKLMRYCSKFIKDPRHHPSLHEDIAICMHMYPELISKGFKFAPPRLASKFSLEAPTEYNHRLRNAFGFHGSARSAFYPRTLRLQKKLNLA